MFGFLGPNGAGKTTTIRILLGLARCDRGEVQVLGRRVPYELASLKGRTGAVVEGTAVYPGLTGRRNLSVWGDLSGGVAEARIDVALSRVGLAQAADRPAGGYSFGMRQRLALAGALLTDPELLVLDEPANGLDPAGQAELRDLLRGLAAAGVTVFLSTHYLAEVQATCDDVASLHRGRVVRTGSVRDLLSHAVHRHAVRVSSPPAALAALHAAGFEAVERDGWLIVNHGDGAAVAEALGRAAVWPSELRPYHAELEDVFLELTAG